MKIYVDADACPVQKEVIDIAKWMEISVTLVKSYSHFSHEPMANHVETVYVDHGADMADFKIVQLVENNDIVITQDYGLASLCLQKGCHVIHHNGFIYDEKNIDQLLAKRHVSAMARRAGYKTKGPTAFSNEKRERFKKTLMFVLDKALNE